MALPRSQFNLNHRQSKVKLDTFSFDGISLTQMVEPEVSECHRGKSRFNSSEFLQDQQRESHHASSSQTRSRHPFVPAAPASNQVNLKTHKAYSNQMQVGFHPNAMSSSLANIYHQDEQSSQAGFLGGSNRLEKTCANSFDIPLSQHIMTQAPERTEKQISNCFSAIKSNSNDPERCNLVGRTQRGSQLQVFGASNKGCPVVGGVKLRSVNEVPRPFREIFTFPYFNVLQSLLFDEILYTDKSVVASAPTGSGKTVIFELALIRLLIKSDGTRSRGKIVYMAPMKALCSERFLDWNDKFGSLGIKCLEVTGDSELDDLTELITANLICTTPEKWDSMSRRWKDNKKLFQQIQLFLIDEIHVLNDPNRGATVEAVVSRMKTLETGQNLDSTTHIRFVAVSATMPNYKDIAEWLGTPNEPASSFNLGEECRPVKLDRIVLGYPFKEGTSDFRFDMNLSYRLKSIIETHSHGKPSLVFCSSRKSVVQSADALAGALRTNSLLTHFGVEILHTAAKSVHEHKLSELLHRGIGIHHAGLTLQDRHTVEELFKASQLPVLISTSTLAMGVNLPAHLVVVKSTHCYNMGMVQEYSDMQVLQMIGRAGRPQFDTSATAVIMTKAQLKAKYSTLVNGTQQIESSLHKNLIEHLNAEIVLQTISDMNLVVEWIRHTFLYVRVMKNPHHYGLPVNLSTQEVEKKLQDLCLQNVTHLASQNLVSVSDNMGTIWPTDNGKLMARYCIAFETMKQFSRIDESQESIAEMIKAISHCAEFDDVQLRTNEKRTLNLLNRDKNKETIRFSLPGKIKTKQMKVNCLIQAQLSCLPVQDFSLSQDMARIFRVGQRVAKCLMEFMYQGSSYSLLLHALLVYKAFKTKLWFDSRYVARQLDGIGSTMSLALANSGLCSFEKLEQAHPRDIEMIVNRHPPFGNQVKEALATLPRYELSVEQMKCYKPHKSVLTLSVDLLNRSALETVPSSQVTHQSILIVGDTDNKIVFKWRVFDAAILRDGVLTRTVEVNRASKGTKLNISLLSQDTVGLDIQTEYEPVYEEGWFQPCKNPSTTKGETPASKLRAAMDNAKSKSQAKGSCNHRCVDKSTCGHKCCKLNTTGKRTTAQVVRTDEVGGKAPRVENSLYKETKGMQDILSILGKQQPRTRINMHKVGQEEGHKGDFQIVAKAPEPCTSNNPENRSNSSKVISLMREDSDDQRDDSMSDVIIIEGDEFDDDDFEDLNDVPTTVNCRQPQDKLPSSLRARKERLQNMFMNNFFNERQVPSNLVVKDDIKYKQVPEKKTADYLNLQRDCPSKCQENNYTSGRIPQQVSVNRVALKRQEQNHLQSTMHMGKFVPQNTLCKDMWEDRLPYVSHTQEDEGSNLSSGPCLENDQWACHSINDKDGDDELPSLTNSPEITPSLAVVQQQKQNHHQEYLHHHQYPRAPSHNAYSPWTTTTSSDEELLQVVDNSTIPSTQPGSLQVEITPNYEQTDTGSGKAQRLYRIEHDSGERHNSETALPLKTLCKASRTSSYWCDPNQTSRFGGLSRRSNADKENQSSQDVYCASNPKVQGSGYGKVEFRAASRKLIETRQPTNFSSVAVQPSEDDPLLSTVISVTNSELSSVLSVRSELELGVREADFDGDSLKHRKTANKENDSSLFGMYVDEKYSPARRSKGDCDINITPATTHSVSTMSKREVLLSSGMSGSEPQSSHRYGHVLAWNKTNNASSQQQPSSDLKQEKKPPKDGAFSFFHQGYGLPREGAKIISTSLFDGIF